MGSLEISLVDLTIYFIEEKTRTDKFNKFDTL